MATFCPCQTRGGYNVDPMCSSAGRHKVRVGLHLASCSPYSRIPLVIRKLSTGFVPFAYLVPVKMEANVERMTVKQLQDFLRKHGQLVSGKKEELVRRARGTLLLRKDCEDAVNDAVERNDADCDMKVFSLKGWCNPEAVALADWPDITDKELYNFMVYKCHKSVDMKRKNARRQLKAHVCYDDRHVHSVSYLPVAKDSDQCYLKCLVIPSAASSNTNKYPDRKVWLSASKVTGQIVKAYCDCTAGREGSCNHVSAFLYALVDITAHKRNGLDASTSSQCKWNLPRKRKLSPKKAADFKSKKARRVSTFSGSGGISLQCLTEKLKSCNPDCGIVINFLAKEVPSEQPKRLPSNPVPDFMFADFVDLKSDKCTTVFTKFASEQILSDEDILLIEQETRQQSLSQAWAELRQGKLTSSNFGQVCKRKPSTQPDGLLKTVLGYRPQLNNEHIKWGRTHEAAARRKYLLHMQSQHHGHVQVHKSGLVLDREMPFLATSPDGLVNCQHCQPVQGLLEVKCPSVHKNKTPEEACSDSDFCCQLIDGQVRLKENHSYFFQVQGQMGVSGKLWCDFVIWTRKEC